MATSADEGFASVNEDSQDGSEGPLSAKQKAEIERKKRLAQKRKQQKKKTRKNKSARDDEAEEDVIETDVNDDVEIEYITEKPVEVLVDPEFIQFGKLFDKFDIKEEKDDAESKKAEIPEPTTKLEEDVKAAIIKAQGAAGGTKAAIIEKILKDEEDGKKNDEDEKKKLSRRKHRISLRPSMALLKASCPRPDVVEWHDVTARDPFFLVYLKSLRNTVPVPRHWNAKRKYLAGKRGFERPPFQLPDFIVKTGIMEMRAAIQEKEDSQSLKNMMRNRVRPKIGRVDIDYQKLHDAFFKHQTKPKMTMHGDLYYEGKEFEAQMREKKPGELSDDLRISLGMPVGPNAFKFPPPWLIAMQRYGPPPSYPHLKIPGLNAPIPDGCSFGYQAGGWGKPPVDEYGQPLYGDVFGLETTRAPVFDDVVQHQHWGEMEEQSDDSDEESDEEEENDDNKTEAGDADKSGLQTPMTEGLMTPSGITSGVNTSVGLETPESTIELRKQKQQNEGVETPAAVTTAQGPAKSLYQVLPEKKVDRIAGQMMASTHVYDISKDDKKSKSSGDGIEVSLNPDELTEIGEEGLKKKYEEQLRKERGTKDDGDEDQDFSDMVAEHAARQKRKRKADDTKKTSSSSSSSSKKQKDFKF